MRDCPAETDEEATNGGRPAAGGPEGEGDRAAYRVRQFWRGLRAQVSAEEIAEIERVLPPAALHLFRRMPVDAQRHSLDVLAGVRAAENGETPHDLEAAALLHDAGKLAAEQAGVHIGLWLRGPLVLLDALAPELAGRLASDAPRSGWRYALHVHHNHARIGAHWAAAVGCTARACWLIAHHQDTKPPAHADPDALRLLRCLQRADNEN